MKSKIIKLFHNEKFIFAVYSLVAIGIFLQKFLGGSSRYNNFTIFRQSFFHLLHQQNLYIEYPKEYFDVFLYNPSYPILFSPFTLFPVGVGLCLWSLFTSSLTFFTIRSLPFSTEKKVFIWWFAVIEMATNLHNMQTNAIIMCLIVLTFVFLERNRPGVAALFPLLAFFIKGYGLIGAALFLFYPQKVKYIGFSVLWTILLGALPLLVTSPTMLWWHYEGWLQSMQADHTVNLGVSIMGVMHNFIHMFDKAIYVQLLGLLLLAFTLVRNLFNSRPDNATVRLYLASYLLLWVVLFNHNSESCTFIIPVVGVAMWFVHQPRTPLTLFLIWFVFIITILGSTDVYPPSIRLDIFTHRAWKAFPCILVWLLIQYELIFAKNVKNLVHAASREL